MNVYRFNPNLWYVNKRVGFSERIYSVCHTIDDHKGIIELIADNLTQNEAEQMVREHNEK